MSKGGYGCLLRWMAAAVITLLVVVPIMAEGLALYVDVKDTPTSVNQALPANPIRGVGVYPYPDFGRSVVWEQPVLPVTQSPYFVFETSRQRLRWPAYSINKPCVSPGCVGRIVPEPYGTNSPYGEPYWLMPRIHNYPDSINMMPYQSRIAVMNTIESRTCVRFINPVATPSFVPYPNTCLE